MLKDFRLGNPHALDYCLPANPPKALYTPPRERRSALQQALDAAGDAFTTGRSRMDWLVKQPEPAQPVEPREFRVGHLVVAIDGCAPWYSCGDRGVVDVVDDQDGTIRVDFTPSPTVQELFGHRSWWCRAKDLRHEGAAL